uniref:Putative dhfr-coamplified protein n=1 Tax=Culex tarsalis TaxID=7177 RepID=A0A1Q3FN09_CULTA
MTSKSDTFTSGELSTQDYVKSPQLTDLTWAHAVNNKNYLDKVLNGNTNFIEADILIGNLENGNPRDQIPVMAHPPATQSNLSLTEFLAKCLQFNQQVEKTQVKGIKLDFKSIEALEKSTDLIKQFYNTVKYPTWINADILAGPVNNTSTTPVDPDRFFNCTKRLGPVILSIGWTTKWDQHSTEGLYSETDIQRMIYTIKSNEIDKLGTPITFPIRAGIAANSLKELSQLFEKLKTTNEITFTIWSSVDDAVDVQKLRNFVYAIGTDRIYIDVPDELKTRLNINTTEFE